MSEITTGSPFIHVTKTPKPVSEKLAEFQARFNEETANLQLSDPKYQQILNNYQILLQMATIERITEALSFAGQGYKMPPLMRELNKAQSNLERTAARFARERAAQERDARRQQREEERKQREQERAQLQRERDQSKIRAEELKLQRAKVEAETKAAERAQRQADKEAKAIQFASKRKPGLQSPHTDSRRF